MERRSAMRGPHESSLALTGFDPKALQRLPALSGAPRMFRAALRLMARNWLAGSLTLVTPAGAELHLAGEKAGPAGRLVIHDYRFMRRVLASGDIGLAEGYMA